MKQGISKHRPHFEGSVGGCHAEVFNQNFEGGGFIEVDIA